MIYQGAAEPKADPVKQQASRSTRIELEPIGLTEHGRRYRVTYAGETLVEGRRNPIFDACRALLARGITGRLEVWRRGKTIADMQLDIERDARLAILETATETLRVVPWRPREPRSDITSPNAVSRRSLQPPGGDLHVAGRVAYPGADAGSRSRIGTPGCRARVLGRVHAPVLALAGREMARPDAQCSPCPVAGLQGPQHPCAGASGRR